MKDFHKLSVWKKSHELVLVVYRETETFPRDEVFGLISQMRRAAVSIPANIAEGCGRQGDAELGHFLQIAMGSASELEYELILARDLHYIDEERYVSINSGLSELKRMLNVLIQKVRSQPIATRQKLTAKLTS